MLKNILDSFKHIPYTWKHKMAVLKVEKNCTGKNSFKIYLHDMDKIIMYVFCPFLGTSKIKNIHRVISKHHHFNSNYLSNSTVKEIIFDWESARLTKPSKPASARSYALAKHIGLYAKMKPFLDDWNI